MGKIFFEGDAGFAWLVDRSVRRQRNSHWGQRLGVWLSPRCRNNVCDPALLSLSHVGHLASDSVHEEVQSTYSYNTTATDTTVQASAYARCCFLHPLLG
jgi:hypothetical protein